MIFKEFWQFRMEQVERRCLLGEFGGHLEVLRNGTLFARGTKEVGRYDVSVCFATIEAISELVIARKR